MPVSDIMTRKLITVAPDISIGELHPMFKQFGIHHLLVVEDGQLVGMISDRDVLRNISPFAYTAAAEKKDQFTLTRKAHQIMTKNLITVGPNSGIRDACDVMLRGNVSLLPVVDHGKLVGVLSWKDILGYFIQ
jgi:acetoin utilization protein AcuB